MPPYKRRPEYVQSFLSAAVLDSSSIWSYWMRKYRSAEWQQYLPLPLTLTLVKFETFIFETKDAVSNQTRLTKPEKVLEILSHKKMLRNICNFASMVFREL